MPYPPSRFNPCSTLSSSPCLRASNLILFLSIAPRRKIEHHASFQSKRPPFQPNPTLLPYREKNLISQAPYGREWGRKLARSRARLTTEPSRKLRMRAETRRPRSRPSTREWLHLWRRVHHHLLHRHRHGHLHLHLGHLGRRAVRVWWAECRLADGVLLPLILVLILVLMLILVLALMVVLAVNLALERLVVIQERGTGWRSEARGMWQGRGPRWILAGRTVRDHSGVGIWVQRHKRILWVLGKALRPVRHHLRRRPRLRWLWRREDRMVVAARVLCTVEAAGSAPALAMTAGRR